MPMPEEKDLKEKQESKTAKSADVSVEQKQPEEAEVKEAAPFSGELKLEVKPKKKTNQAKTSKTTKIKKKKVRRQVQKGCAFIRSSYNNTVVSLSDLHGNMLAWSSSGLLGFKGAKKATTYAATQVVLDVDEKVQKYGLRDVDVYIKGIGGGREAALRALAQKGYNITRIKDITPIPHNGCRPKKPRRV